MAGIGDYNKKSVGNRGFKMNSPLKMDLTKKKGLGPRAKKKTNDKGTLKLFLEKRGDKKGALTPRQMQNTGDFNVSNLHKDTKISLDKKKKKLAANKASNKKRSDAERALEAKEDAMGL